MYRGDAAYYEREVTRDLEAYFDGRGEEAGRWIGRGAAAAGLEGRVEEGQLTAVFDQGCHPVTGEGLGIPFSQQKSPNGKTVTGYGLTFSPPKSVSLLWGLGDEPTHAEVRAGHDAAVAAGLGFLEDHAAFSRRGKAGVFQIDTCGYQAAAFTHRTSRADDPQLHTHVLVSSKVLGTDGKWRSLDGREVFEFQKAAGGIYQAALRTELTARLGVAWGEIDRNGQADLVAVPQGLLEAFSARRSQVLEAGAERIATMEANLGRPLSEGEKAEQYQRAAYATRPAKRHGAPSEATLRERWRADAAALGYPVEHWLDKTVSDIHRAQVRGDVAAVVREVMAELEEEHSTWSQGHVAKGLARRLPVDLPGGAEAVRAEMGRLMDFVLANKEVVRLTVPEGAAVPSGLCRADGEATFERHGARRYTTRTTLRLEGQVLDAVEAGRWAGVGIARPERVESARRDLGHDQVAALRRLCLGGERIVCLVGPAGTGKTRTLAGAASAWTASGIAVRGLAVSASAAEVLAAETAMSCDTVAKLLFEHDQDNRAWRLRPGEVVVVDEASMLSTRQLAELACMVERAEGKLVLIGDPRQLGNRHRFARTCGRRRLNFTGFGGERRRRCQRGSRALLCDRCRIARPRGRGRLWSRAGRGGCSAVVGG
jgi:conjugative relaxase-like TrwC/TraI family protein